jgi:hypothetical protein
MFRSFGNSEEEKKAFFNYVTATTAMNRLGTPDEIIYFSM